MTTFGSLARVIGPIIVTTTYTAVGTYLSLGIVAGSMVIALIINLAVYDRLVPLQINQQRTQRDENDDQTIVEEILEN